MSRSTVKKTLFDKIWDAHVVAVLPGGEDILHVDRHLMHELTGVDLMGELQKRKLAVHSPELTFATVDHVISTRPGRTAGDEAWSTAMVDALRSRTTRLNIKRFDIEDGRQGIVHVKLGS